MFWKWPISIIGKMLNIGADNRSTPMYDSTDNTVGMQYNTNIRKNPQIK